MSVFSDILGTATSTGIISPSFSSGAALRSSAKGLADTLINTALTGGSSTPGNDFAGINARSDAIQNWCWYCLMPSIQGQTTSASLPWYYVQKANLPLRTFDRDTVKRNGHDVHYAEGYKVGDLSLEFFMDSSNASQLYLYAWQSLILGNANPAVAANQGLWGLPAAYKKTINVVVLSMDKKILLNVKYLNCWPVDPSALDLVSGSAEAMSQPITFAVEDVSIEIHNTQGTIQSLINSTVSTVGNALNSLQGAAVSSIQSFFG